MSCRHPSRDSVELGVAVSPRVFVDSSGHMTGVAQAKSVQTEMTTSALRHFATKHKRTPASLQLTMLTATLKDAVYASVGGRCALRGKAGSRTVMTQDSVLE